jgi:hypothetical protein
MPPLAALELRPHVVKKCCQLFGGVPFFKIKEM